MIKLSLITLLHTLEQSLELNQETNYCIWADCKLLQHSKMQLQVRFQENCTTLEALKMHRTFLKLLTNYSSEKKPSDRTHLLVGHHSANKKWSERNAASFKVIPAAPHALCRGTATSQLHPTRRQNLFFFLLLKSEIRNLMSLCSQYQDQIDLKICPLQQVITCTGHTSICCKILGTCIFSGFQKQFLGVEGQYGILLLAGKPGLTWT